MIYKIPPRQSVGKDFSAYWDNFLTNEEINKILAMPEWLNTAKASVGGSSGNGEIVEKIRTTDINWLGLNSDTAWLWEKLTDVIAEVNANYFKFDLTGCYEPIQLGVYKENDGGHYDWHIDAGVGDRKAPRKLSMSLLLSDPSEFEGGELQIKAVNDEVCPLGMVKGRAWFFPSYTLHRVTPVTKGVRRSLVLWVGGPEFK
jgi:PKHD-type hydroxylase